MSDAALPPPAISPRLIALITDFGLDDWFVAAMKGEILKRVPTARLLDISHGIAPQQIATGAFVLESALDSLPEETVICAVVDPGVGTARRAICGRIGRFFWSGPDNGLSTVLLERAAGDHDLHVIANPEFRNPHVAATFHGRDLFAPAAAMLALGRDPAAAGPRVSEPILLPALHPQSSAEGLLARVMTIDHFGNLISNVRRAEYDSRLQPGRFILRAGSITIDAIHQTFAQVHTSIALAYWGSAGTLEIGVNLGSAASLTGLRAGDVIHIRFV